MSRRRSVEKVELPSPKDFWFSISVRSVSAFGFALCVAFVSLLGSVPCNLGAGGTASLYR